MGAYINELKIACKGFLLCVQNMKYIAYISYEYENGTDMIIRSWTKMKWAHFKMISSL